MTRFFIIGATGLLGLGVLTGSAVAQRDVPRPGLGQAYRPMSKSTGAVLAKENAIRRANRPSAPSPTPSLQTMQRLSAQPWQQRSGYPVTGGVSRSTSTSGVMRVINPAVRANTAASGSSVTRLQAVPRKEFRAVKPTVGTNTAASGSSVTRSQLVPGKIDSRILSKKAGCSIASPGNKSPRPLAARVHPGGANELPQSLKLSSGVAGKLTGKLSATGGGKGSPTLKSRSVPGGKVLDGIKPEAAAKLLRAAQDASKPKLADRALPDGRGAKPVALITTDEDGTEHWEGTMDEELAINNGGRYEWTDAEGGQHVTEVTPEGTRRTYTDGEVASESFTPHERREAVPETNTETSGADTAWGIVGGVLSSLVPYIPAFGGTAYYDPGYVVPGYEVPVDPAYVSPGFESGLIPGTRVLGGENAAAADPGTTKFTRRLLHVANNTSEPVTVYVQFRTQVEGGQWSWLPADPATSPEALAFELAPGQAGYLDHNGAPISASRIRIWAQSATRSWNTHQHEDLWLVSELDANGQRAYFATEMETYPFTLD